MASTRTAEEQKKLDSLDKQKQDTLLKLQADFIKEQGHRAKDLHVNLDLHCFVRFLQPRKWDYQVTKKFMEEWFDWRTKIAPHKVTHEEVKNELGTGKCYWNGRDKDGHIIAVIRPHLHITAKRDYDECLKFVYYSAETGVAQMGETNDRYVVLYDARNIGMQNLDLAFVKEFFKFANYYPERLQNMLIYKPNVIYSSLLALAKPFIDPVTASKLVMIQKDDELLQYVSKDQLEVDFGGTVKYTYNMDTYVKQMQATRNHELQLEAQELDLD